MKNQKKVTPKGGAIRLEEHYDARQRALKSKCKTSGLKQFVICRHPLTVCYLDPNDKDLEKKLSKYRDRMEHPSFYNKPYNYDLCISC